VNWYRRQPQLPIHTELTTNIYLKMTHLSYFTWDFNAG
jgi:hypothetical protein